MAHEIDFTTQAQGSAMFAYKPAWHGFGTVVSEAQTSADALRIAGLDWDVRLTDLAAIMPDGSHQPIDTHRATMRTDTGAALGAVGLRYQPLQNREAFAWMDEVVGGDDPLAMWHTCGSLRSGKRVWMLAKMPGHVEVTDTDVLDKYVLITNSHDGTGAVRLFPTSVRATGVSGPLSLATAIFGGTAPYVNTYLSQIGYVAAAVGVAVGVSFLGERYPPLVWAGISVVAAGIGLTTLAQARAVRRA